MKKLILIITLFFSGLLTSFAQGAAPGSGTEIDLDDESETPAKSNAEEKKTQTTSDTTGPSSYLLEFSQFNLGNNTPAAKTPATVTILTQTWMGSNLDVTTFRNGDAITQAQTDSDWEVAYTSKKPAWCYYNYDQTNEAKFGKLYNVYAVTDARGLAPSGWHIPDKEECDKLITALPDNADTGTKLKSIGEGGYAFVQGGYKSQNDFISSGKLGVWWTSTKKTIYGAWGASVNDGAYAFSLYFEHNRFYISEYSSEGLSVRCIKD